MDQRRPCSGGRFARMERRVGVGLSSREGREVEMEEPNPSRGARHKENGREADGEQTHTQARQGRGGCSTGSSRGRGKGEKKAGSSAPAPR